MSADLVSLGMRVVFDGRLRDLRDELSMSRTTMAGLIGISPESLRKWESGRQGMKVDTALRIAHWWQGANKAIDDLMPEDEELTLLVPIVNVVAHLGVSQQTVMKWCRDGEIKYRYLGPLGDFIYKTEVPGLESRTT